MGRTSKLSLAEKEMKKAELLELAKRGGPRPPHGAGDGYNLNLWTKYDTVFHDIIREANPKWLRPRKTMTVAERKAWTLEQTVRPTVFPDGREAYQYIRNYISTSSSAFDPEFRAKYLTKPWARENSKSVKRDELVRQFLLLDRPPEPSLWTIWQRVQRNRLPLLRKILMEHRPEWFE